jgi:hypothetical protein
LEGDTFPGIKLDSLECRIFGGKPAEHNRGRPQAASVSHARLFQGTMQMAQPALAGHRGDDRLFLRGCVT